MSKNLHSFITVAALLSLLHCAYSAAQHRFYLRLTEQQFSQLPLDVVAQTLISLIALIYGTSFIANPFQFIKKDQHHDRTCDEALNCPSFITFDNRIKAISSNLATIKTTLRSPNDSNRKALDFGNIPAARIPKNTKKAKVHEITKKQADEAFENCLQLVKKHDVDNYLSILTMPKNVQPEFVAIDALNVEIAQIREKVDTRRGDTSAMYRLQFWKDAIMSIYGLSTLTIPRQPVAIALCVFAPNARSDLLLKMIETRQATIGDRQFENIEALIDYGKSTTGSLLHLKMSALARQTSTTLLPNAIEICEEVGAAYAVANLIRSTHPLLARGIVLIPADVMGLNGTNPDSIYNKKKVEESKGVVKDLFKVSENLLNSSRSRIDEIPKHLRPALVSTCASIDHILKITKKVDYDIYSPLLQRRNPLLLWSLFYRKLVGKY
ncbi:unnamed protein product [Caenorhabditis bovis]|uniref:Uncharacterized protein n=1 Tax=Caenorhabditis bovis TaxID=2654633 RepID=A0A8S1EZI5_9PELO|nr:unnamed protein product [Caenorhabditis bovis]